MASNQPISLPGQHLGTTETSNVGAGTHIQSGHIYSSLAGALTSSTATTKSGNGKKPTTKQRPSVSVTRPSGAQLLPEVGTVVVGRITRTGPRQANLSILALGGNGEHVISPAASSSGGDGGGFPAIIRQQDIRATEIDKVKVGESFRVGDVVRAVVISLGDEKAYYCSTARNELGVVLAVSEWGNQMFPASWREFVDPATGLGESRKVAKPA
ncbi:hypothetical protein K431DRAFT_282763 [Polychaeton citri CBS 116435]|uniref:S1 motif domain-containing protein n=1 Tax=Polychaeton citri CBS 116435 TaxID=1314669 RepID=A0A9P4QEX9_9PEZI|nr:hypothetical protein K431DRAFT_282763 [Polychaeton citri CBS 116435]